MVSPGATVTCELDSTSGVNSCSWSIVSADDLTYASISGITLTVSGVHDETCTFPFPNFTGRAVIIQARINGGRNPQMEVDPDMTATAKAYSETVGGGEVGCVGEQYESDATMGSTAVLNYAIRNVAGSAVLSVTGTAPIVSSGGQNPDISATLGSPVAIGTANSDGVAASLPRSDHVHALGFATVQTVLGGATGNVSFNTVKITSLGTPTDATDAATKGYVDTAVSGLASSSTTLTGTAPIQVDGDNAAHDLSANRTISIVAASSLTAGSMSTTHYDLVQGATSSPTADTLAKRGASGELAGAWFAPALAGVATAGLLRATGAAQTVIGARNSLSATFSAVSITALGGTIVGDYTDGGDVAVRTPSVFSVTDGAYDMVSASYSIDTLTLAAGTAGANTATLNNSGFAVNAPVFAENTRIDVNELTYSSTAGAITVSQTKRSSTGANAGSSMSVSAQAGQDVAAGTNNDGGALNLSGGAAGTGGSGGSRGAVVLSGGSSTGTLDSSAWTVTAPVVATYYAATLTSIASAGLLRTTSASQTIVAALKSGGGADVTIAAIDGSDNITIGDATDAATITVASASGVKLADGSITHTIDATTVSFDATAGAIGVSQAQRTGTGANAGSSLTIAAQAGQNQTGGAANNAGGDLILKPGNAGTGGSGGTAYRGNVALVADLADYGGADGCVAISTADNPPSTSPDGGVVLYASPEGALGVCTPGATTVPSFTTLAPPITDTGAVGVTRLDYLEDRAVKQTTDGSTITLWSYTPLAGESVRLRTFVEGRRSTLHLREERVHYINTGAGVPALTTDTIGTNLNTLAGGTSVEYDYSGGDIRIRCTGDATPNTIVWRATVKYEVFEP